MLGYRIGYHRIMANLELASRYLFRPGDGATQEVSMLVLELEDVVGGLAPAEAVLAFLVSEPLGSARRLKDDDEIYIYIYIYNIWEIWDDWRNDWRNMG